MEPKEWSFVESWYEIRTDHGTVVDSFSCIWESGVALTRLNERRRKSVIPLFLVRVTTELMEEPPIVNNNC